MKKFYLLLCLSFCFVCSSFAQTLIDPNTGGGFDVGNTFLANGWTVVNSSANQWVVGPATYLVHQTALTFQVTEMSGIIHTIIYSPHLAFLPEDYYSQ